jgi:hypothetical protein
MIRIAIENTTNEMQIQKIENHQLKEKSESKNAILAISIGILLSNFATSQPESGIPIIALAGIIINKFPRSSSVKL